MVSIRNDRLLVIQSAPLSNSALPRALEGFVKAYAKEEYLATVYSADASEPIDVGTVKLFPFSAVDVTTGDVTVEHQFRATDESIEPFLKFLSKYAREVQHTAVWWGVREADKMRPGSDPYDCVTSAGWTDFPDWKAGYFWCGLDLQRRSPGLRDKSYRREAFERAFESMGVGNAVSATIDDDDTLRVSAQEPWRIRFRTAGLKGEDPYSVAVCSFADVDAAFAAARGVLEHVAKEIISVRFTCKMRAELFPKLLGPLNETATGWTQDTGGTLTAEAAKVLKTGLTNGVEPQIIPVMQWLEEEKRDAANEFQVNVRVANDGARIQIVSDCGDVDELFKRAAVAGDLKFRPVP